MNRGSLSTEVSVAAVSWLLWSWAPILILVQSGFLSRSLLTLVLLGCPTHFPPFPGFSSALVNPPVRHRWQRVFILAQHLNNYHCHTQYLWSNPHSLPQRWCNSSASKLFPQCLLLYRTHKPQPLFFSCLVFTNQIPQDRICSLSFKAFLSSAPDWSPLLF